ncbi:MAG: glycosyltransferase family 2 protein [Candidatus Aenigmatarchaeota archaeon]
MTDLYYAIAAYNEENRIGRCLDSIAQQKLGNLRTETIVCLNGCNDRTADVVLERRKRHPVLNIRTLHSKKGKVFAHNEIVHNIHDPTKPVAFVDADVALDRDAIGILYGELGRINSLQAVGGHSVPYRPEGMSPWQAFLYEILHARSLFPMSEISVNDVSHYKLFADTHPQTDADPEFEKKSKIYFHGRLFMLRNNRVFEMPEDENLADDSFLPNSIHTRYGPGSSRVRYDAIAYYEPYLSLHQHFRAYRRVDAQLRYLDANFKNFRESREMERTKLDWEYIRSTGIPNVLRFAAYSAVRDLEHAAYRVLPDQSPTDLWK